MAPLVSVVIPAYNRADVISDAVASAFAQTHRPIETVVVDDGSTDDTLIVLKGLAARYGAALRIVRQANAGASAARNAGLDAASGAFVQFLDSDDVLRPEKVELQLAALQDAPDAAAALCYGTLEEEEGDTEIGMDLGEIPFNYIEALCGRVIHIVPTLAPLWRRGFLGGERRWNITLSLGDDLEFHVRCFADAQRVVFVRHCLFTVRKPGGDRLSDFSANNSRLTSLLATREVVYDVLKTGGVWTPGCSRQMATAVRSLYANFLNRMSCEELVRIENFVVQANLGSLLVGLTRVRRTLGRQAALRLLQHARSTSGLLDRWHPSRIRRWLVRRVRKLIRLHPFDAILTVKSFASYDLRHPSKRMALLVEANAFHLETLPGYVQLLAAAGFRTTILHRPRADVPGALCRLPDNVMPAVRAMSLGGMGIFLRRRLIVERFDLLVLNSVTIAEPFGYFGSFAQYMGLPLKGRNDLVSIVHSVRHLREGADWEHINKAGCFALRPVRVDDTELPMLAPVDFGAVKRASLATPLKFVVVGRIAGAYRNTDSLVAALTELLSGTYPPFEVHVVGAGSPATFPDAVRGVIRFHGELSFEAMYEVVENAHVFLPLLDSRVRSHRDYLTGVTSGSRQLVLGFEKVSVWERPFAEIYGFDEKSALIHKPGDLIGGLKAALELDPARYERMMIAVAEVKRVVFQASLANLKDYLEFGTNDRGRL